MKNKYKVNNKNANRLFFGGSGLESSFTENVYLACNFDCVWRKTKTRKMIESECNKTNERTILQMVQM